VIRSDSGLSLLPSARQGDMPDALQYFVIIFSRIEANRIRAEAAIRASSEQHATWLASHFTGMEQGAVALSRSDRAPPQKGADVKILCRFGGALPTGSSVLALKKALGPLELAKFFSAANPARTKRLPNRRSASRRRQPP
jgi:hypothetical protein